MEISSVLFLIICSVVDIMCRKIPVWFVWGYMLIGIVISIGIEDKNIFGVILCLLPGVSVLFISMITKGGIGIGDGAVFIALGIYNGLEVVLLTLLCAMFLCTVFSIVAFVLKKVKMNQEIPFVPFILVAYLGVLLL